MNKYKKPKNVPQPIKLINEPITEKELTPKKFLNDLNGMFNKNRVNVLYLTTMCNLNCDYCYEKNPERKRQITLSKESCQDFLNEIADREKGLVSTLVIMGGEVFLEFSTLMDVLWIAKKMNHEFAISVVTNGTLLKNIPLEKFKLFYSLITTLEISYDGSGSDRRTYKTGGTTKPIVEFNLATLRHLGLKYKISYTVHKDNYKNLLFDMIWIMTKLRPSAIKLSFACQELSDAGVDYKKFKQDFLEYAEQLYMSYGIPICDLSCSQCLKCDSSNFCGNSYLSPKTNKITYEDTTTLKKFDVF
jgi:sulfatase maturation enzyme AslB (radical SAM superfamily)